MRLFSSPSENRNDKYAKRKQRWLLLPLALAACTPTVTTPPPPTQPAPAQAPVDFSSSKWGEFPSERFNLRVPLPDGKAWRIDDHHSQWLVAKHQATGSELAMRTWNDENRMNRDKCEEIARATRKLPPREGAEIIEKDRLGLPPDFDTVMEVGLVPPDKPGVRSKRS